MELTVFDGEKQVGSLRAEADGLFYDVSCSLAPGREAIRRVYVGHSWKSEYLGIPDGNGNLRARLPKKRLPDGISFAVASDLPRGAYIPWRGEADGVPIAEGYIRTTGDGIDLLLPPQEAVKLPAWAEYMHTETAFGRELMRISLLPDGTLPEKKTDRGEQRDEENTCDTVDDRMPYDDVPGDGLGNEGRQADCADL